MTKTRILPLFGEGGGGAQGIQGIQGAAGIDGTNGIQGIQGAAGGAESKIELLDLPMETLVEFYQATLAGTMRDFSQYTANGYTIINAYKFNAGWEVEVPGGGGTYTTDGTEVALLLNHTFYARGVIHNEDTKYINEWIELFSPTIVMTYGGPLGLAYSLGNGTGIQGIQGAAGIDGTNGIQGIQGAAGGGSSSNAWYGSQAEFRALQHPDPDTDYFISEIRFDEIKGVPAFAKQSDIYTAKDEVLSEVHEDFEHLHGEYMSMQQFQAITPKENYNYFIEGSTIEMVVTFTDDTTATYNVVVD